MNRLQRQFRAISDANLDDTAKDIQAVDQAAVAVDLTERALATGMVTTTEALGILAEERAVLATCLESYRLNLVVQTKIDALTALLAQLPANCVARIPRAA